MERHIKTQTINISGFIFGKVRALKVRRPIQSPPLPHKRFTSILHMVTEIPAGFERDSSFGSLNTSRSVHCTKKVNDGVRAFMCNKRLKYIRFDVCFALCRPTSFDTGEGGISCPWHIKTHGHTSYRLTC
uniref:Uncharacterized protein n=1 Tax=Amphimedon queenslandica TaxID=400682 RepID=A0A1X7SQT3_AMPQE